MQSSHPRKKERKEEMARESIYVEEAVLRHKFDDGRLLFLVAWLGYATLPISSFVVKPTPLQCGHVEESFLSLGGSIIK